MESKPLKIKFSKDVNKPKSGSLGNTNYYELMTDEQLAQALGFDRTEFTEIFEKSDFNMKEAFKDDVYDIDVSGLHFFSDEKDVMVNGTAQCTSSHKDIALAVKFGYYDHPDSTKVEDLCGDYENTSESECIATVLVSLSALGSP